MKKIFVTLITIMALLLSLLPANMAVRTLADEDAPQETGIEEAADETVSENEDISVAADTAEDLPVPAGDEEITQEEFEEEPKYEDISGEITPSEDPFDFTDDGSKYELLDEASGYPATFDLRNVGGANYVTPVRSQAPYGTCWGFAAIAAAESSILGAGIGEGYDVNTLNLSEKQLAFFSAKALDDPTSSQNGEGQYVEDFISIYSLMNRGGNVCIAASVMAQGIGPQHEDAARILGYHGADEIIDYRYINGVTQPYCYSEYDDWSIPESYRFSRSYLLREARILPAPAGRDENGMYEYNPAGTAAIKQELLNNRAVMASFMADTSLPGQESETEYISPEWAHYTCMPVGTSHMVTIVGWDDNYSRDNFLTGTMQAIGRDGEILTFDRTPPYDGAWLVKNSWGSGECSFPDMGMADWGIVNEAGVHTGYFWLSYYDQSLLSAGSLVLDEPVPYDEIIDQYDYMPMTSAMSYSSENELKMANAFWARSNEIIEYVSSFTTAPETDVTYEIYLQTDIFHDPTEGVKVAEATFHYEYGGYHKESMDDFDILFDTGGTGSNDILIMKDQCYTIVVTQIGSDGRYYANFQYGSMDEGGGVTNFKGIINSQESWLLIDDFWNDYCYADSIREEIADSLLGDIPYYSYDLISFDNFPIKAFCRKADNNLTITVAPENVDLTYATRLDAANVRCSLYGGTLPDGGINDEDISWCLSEGADQYIEIQNGSNPTRKIMKAINTPDEHAWFVAYVTIRNVGTATFKVGVGSNYVKEFLYDEESSLSEDEPIYLYTGEEIRPIESIDVTVPPAEEGTDFDFVYENNIKCGMASVKAVGKGGMFKEVTLLTRGFAIVPPAPEITLTAGGGSLSVKVTGTVTEGTEGFRIWYREEGAEDWLEEDIAEGKTETVISGLEIGKKYEVKAAGYVTNTPSEETIPCFSEIFFGLEWESPEPVEIPEVPENPVTVTFDFGDGSTSTKTISSGTTVDAPEDPERTGFEFDGWYEDTEFTTAFDFSTPVNTNKTVYAKWIKISYGEKEPINPEWSKGSGKDLIMNIKRNVNDDKAFSLFSSFEVDGSIVDAARYKTEPGSLVLTVSANYLETLSTGTHNFKVNFKDGSFEKQILIKKVEEKPTEANKNDSGKNTPNNSNSNKSGNSNGNPKTGDTARPLIYLTIMVAAVFAITLLIVIMIKRRQR